VGIVRTKEELEQGIHKLGELIEKGKTVRAAGASQYNPGWHEALAVQSLLTVSEAVAKAALMREESRGAHTRLDHPGEQDEWTKNNVVIRKDTDGRMIVEKVARPPGPPELVRIAQAKIEDLEKEIVEERKTGGAHAEAARV
jgi:succinate dehydrogenase / fumarate reductase flavoprotein subunit